MMTLLMLAGVVAGIVLGAILITSRRVRPVLLPVLLVLGIAGLSFAVTWEKEQQRRARETADAALYNQETATIAREQVQVPLPPAQPPIIVSAPSPLQRPPTGAAAPPAVAPPYRPGGAS